MTRPGIMREIADFLGWNRTSYAFFGAFCLLAFLIGYVWWPLLSDYLATFNPAYPWYAQFDWLLLGIFAFMTLLIMMRPDVRSDARIVFVGLVGGLVIEAWGTQTQLWTYYTAERPPLWIIPAWPIASLAIERMVRGVERVASGVVRGPSPSREPEDSRRSTTFHILRSTLPVWHIAYWLLFPAFLLLMLWFVAPTFDKSLTWAALAVSVALVATPTDPRRAVLTFVLGAGLGYFLELWGTTRECWTYYTREAPPLFAVLAHGLAAVAFWRAGLAIGWAWSVIRRQGAVAA
ncbi:MAG TPA: hypothetical protein PK954_15330 [Anaerolineales bacterium]|nr:hypothetical protein [Anaerolineales bacterium]HRF50149.1 hypothetical protein [Anaerolineales bacterium]